MLIQLLILLVSGLLVLTGCSGDVDVSVSRNPTAIPDATDVDTPSIQSQSGTSFLFFDSYATW